MHKIMNRVTQASFVFWVHLVVNFIQPIEPKWILTEYTSQSFTKRRFYLGKARLITKQPTPSQTWINPVTFSYITSLSALIIHFPERVGGVKHKHRFQTSACPHSNKSCPMIGSQIVYAVSCLSSVNNTVKLLNVIEKVRGSQQHYLSQKSTLS